MISWPAPAVPRLPGQGPAVRIFDTATRALAPAATGPTAGIYVCGITPYDATHLGHAFTYLTFDLLNRALRDSGVQVRYVQNVTDIDDPLLERAAATGQDWVELAESETDRFRDDMTAMGVLPPDHYLGAVEMIPQIVQDVSDLVAAGLAYPVPAPDAVAADGKAAHDIYLEVTGLPDFGSVANADEATMLRLFGERGGDPQREGKRNPLDALIWRAARKGEPSWPGGDLGEGRPGWHIECAVIAAKFLGLPFDVQGGGVDLAFPHHEMSAVHGCAVAHSDTFVRLYAHAGMVALAGEKMSKSRGNLVFVSALRAQGVNPMAIRLALLNHHWRTDWEWTNVDLPGAQQRLETWRQALSGNGGAPAWPVLNAVREALANDLNAPAALAAIDAWAQASLSDESDPHATGLIARTIDSLLGVRI